MPPSTQARRGETMVAAQMADRDEGTRFEANPIERIRDLIEANRNYFPSWNNQPKPCATN